MTALDLTPWRTAPGEPLTATDQEIAAATGATPRQVAYARSKAGHPSHGRGRPPAGAEDQARPWVAELRPDQAEALEELTDEEISARVVRWLAHPPARLEALARAAVLREALDRLARLSGALRSWGLVTVATEEPPTRCLGQLTSAQRAELTTRARAWRLTAADLAVEVALTASVPKLRQQARAMARQVGVDLRDL